MLTTLKAIKKHTQCKPGRPKLLRGLGKSRADDEPLSIVRILDINGLDDALWCLRAVVGQARRIRLYAVECAEQVQHLMRDPRSLAALDVAEKYARGKATEAEFKAAQAAARAAERDARGAESNTEWAERAAAWAGAGDAYLTARASAHAAAAWAAQAAAVAADAGAWDSAKAAACAAQADAWDAAWHAARKWQEDKLREICGQASELEGLEANTPKPDTAR